MFRHGLSSSARVFAAVAVCFALAAALLAGCDSPERLTTARVSLDGIEISVEVADTVRERARGFQGRPRPSNNTGMLFVWDEPGPRAFAIEDVTFDLDVIFVGEDGVVTEVLPLSPTGPYRAQGEGYAAWVLEVRGGWASEHGVGPGSRFALDPE